MCNNTILSGAHSARTSTRGKKTVPPRRRAQPKFNAMHYACALRSHICKAAHASSSQLRKNKRTKTARQSYKCARIHKKKSAQKPGPLYNTDVNLYIFILS